MPERSTVAQVSQLGLEVTPGTAVVATRRLGSLDFTPSIQSEVELFRPSGLKFPSVQVLNKEWAEFDAEGVATYNEVIIPLHGAFGTPTVAQIMDATTPTGVYTWTFGVADTTAEAPKTFTLEKGTPGVAGQAERFTHALFTDFELTVNRGEVMVSGSGFAQAVAAAVTLAVGPTTPADLVPIKPGSVSIFLDSTHTALGTTRLTRVVEATPSIGSRYNPAWFVDATQGSFATFVENGDGAEGGCDLTVEADTVGMAWLERLRDGATRFLRIEAVGPTVYTNGATTHGYKFTWDLAVKAEGLDSFGDEDGIYTVPITLRTAYSSAWQKSQQVKVQNTVPSL